MMKKKNKLNGVITFDNYKIPDKIFSQFPLKPDLSDFTAQFNFKSDFNYFDGDLVIKNNLGLNMMVILMFTTRAVFLR